MTDPTALAEPFAETKAASPDIVRLPGVRFAWPGRNAFTLVIENFALERGERLFLGSLSGSGKSAFLSLLAGIVMPQEGVIEVLGTDSAKLSGAARGRFRSCRFARVANLAEIARTSLGGGE